MKWNPNVCNCELELDTETSAYIQTARVCPGHAAVAGDPAHLETLRAECITTRKAVDAVMLLDSKVLEDRIEYSWDEARMMSITVRGSTKTKSQLQTAINLAVGTGKVTVA